MSDRLGRGGNCCSHAPRAAPPLGRAAVSPLLRRVHEPPHALLGCRATQTEHLRQEGALQLKCEHVDHSAAVVENADTRKQRRCCCCWGGGECISAKCEAMPSQLNRRTCGANPAALGPVPSCPVRLPFTPPPPLLRLLPRQRTDSCRTQRLQNKNSSTAIQPLPIMATHRAVVYKGPHDVQIEDVPKPTIQHAYVPVSDLRYGGY